MLPHSDPSKYSFCNGFLGKYLKPRKGRDIFLSASIPSNRYQLKS